MKNTEQKLKNFSKAVALVLFPSYIEMQGGTAAETGNDLASQDHSLHFSGEKSVGISLKSA